MSAMNFDFIRNPLVISAAGNSFLFGEVDIAETTSDFRSAHISESDSALNRRIQLENSVQTASLLNEALLRAKHSAIPVMNAMGTAAHAQVSALNSIDGLVLMMAADDGWHWVFFNRDGSSARMCGNAARAAGSWLEKYHPSGPTRVTTADGIRIDLEKTSQSRWQASWQLVPGQHIAGAAQSISISTEQMHRINQATPKLLNSREVKGYAIDTGVPHFVLATANAFDLTAGHRELAKLLRSHSAWSSEGSNITFVSPHENQVGLKAISFERGVEDFTLACGTGALAAAAFLSACASGKETVFINFGLNSINKAMGTLDQLWIRATTSEPPSSCPVEMPGGTLYAFFANWQAVLS